jgi:hypothetical protein
MTLLRKLSKKISQSVKNQGCMVIVSIISWRLELPTPVAAHDEGEASERIGRIKGRGKPFAVAAVKDPRLAGRYVRSPKELAIEARAES